MGAILGFLVSLAGALFSSLSSYFGRKAVTVTASIAAFVALTAAFWAVMTSLFNTVLGWASMPSWFAASVGLFIPGDLPAVLSAVLAARAARAAYDIAVEKVKLISAAN